MAYVLSEEQKKKRNIYMKEWRKNNRAHIKAYKEKYEKESDKALKRRVAYRKKYHLKNKQAICEKALNWKKSNPKKVAIHGRNRRTLKLKCEGSHTDAEIISLYQKQKGMCVYCGTSLKKEYHVDHIIALIKGGSNWIHNIQLLCPPCNTSKGAKDPVKWAQEKHGLLL
jgi:5-methylcytosine-specific restriction endonuclease McrA